MLWKTINLSFMSFEFQITKVVLPYHLFKFQNDLSWQFNVRRWSDLAPDKPCLPDSQPRISPEQLWIKCFTNYSPRTSSWILNTITLCLKTFKIFYLMGATIAMIAGDCFDLNISVVMRERFKATKVLREYWLTHVLLPVISDGRCEVCSLLTGVGNSLTIVLLLTRAASLPLHQW